MAERCAAVEALLAEGLSDREIARRAGVSPSTVSAVRKGQEAAKIGA
ncbi:helix-turn-helix domain-containing protein [Methylobacterium fujisawaense]